VAARGEGRLGTMRARLPHAGSSNSAARERMLHARPCVLTFPLENMTGVWAVPPRSMKLEPRCRDDTHTLSLRQWRDASPCSSAGDAREVHVAKCVPVDTGCA